MLIQMSGLTSLQDTGGTARVVPSISYLPCFVGFAVDGLNCTACPLGKSTPTINSLMCHECPPGMYADSLGQSACYSCARGYAVSDIGTIYHTTKLLSFPISIYCYTSLFIACCSISSHPLPRIRMYTHPLSYHMLFSCVCMSYTHRPKLLLSLRYG